ncbi:MAG: hypothetical protein ACPL3P_01705 [Anaerolineales bacterium]
MDRLAQASNPPLHTLTYDSRVEDGASPYRDHISSDREVGQEAIKSLCHVKKTDDGQPKT